MSRKLLLLALLVSGTGCSATRPLLSTIVVTPPRVSFRQLPPEDAGHWTVVAVTYPSETLIPAPCAPAPVRPMELVMASEEDEIPAPESPSEPVPSVKLSVPVPPVDVPASAPPAIVHLEDATSPESFNQPMPSVAPVSSGNTSHVQSSVAVMSPSRTLSPPACAPSPVRSVQLVTFIEEDEGPAPPAIVQLENTTSSQSVNQPESSVASFPPGTRPMGQTASTSSPSVVSDWKPATRDALVSPIQSSAAIQRDLDKTTLSEVRPVLPVESLSPPVVVQADLSELLTEIRNQRQLIEALQRDLARERSADDAAIDELEAAVENLLVQTQIDQPELPTTLRK